jgi:hypothetical protein
MLMGRRPEVRQGHPEDTFSLAMPQSLFQRALNGLSSTLIPDPAGGTF